MTFTTEAPPQTPLTKGLSTNSQVPTHSTLTTTRPTHSQRNYYSYNNQYSDRGHYDDDTGKFDVSGGRGTVVSKDVGVGRARDWRSMARWEDLQPSDSARLSWNEIKMDRVERRQDNVETMLDHALHELGNVRSHLGLQKQELPNPISTETIKSILQNLTAAPSTSAKVEIDINILTTLLGAGTETGTDHAPDQIRATLIRSLKDRLVKDEDKTLQGS
ncbi:hypothetical protein HK097_009237 [Rhizophlyctis rosea]|uniref:Uncharacterized protein n=1 Tax=Rhizophlyctis rosea TaxID=64517 RepID=A0AAD5SBD4_9FUNG|nr:hypothetical protein HK097_009237 [Rhizophlyctis rosea]